MKLSNFHFFHIKHIIESEIPGPGAYDPKDKINKQGEYFLSTMKNSTVRKFGEPSTDLTFYSSVKTKTNTLHRSFNN
jgi:hypothetical protein